MERIRERLPKGGGEQHSGIFGLPVGESVEGLIFTGTEPLARGSAPVILSRLRAGETWPIGRLGRVKLRRDPGELTRPKMRRLVGQRSAKLAA